MHLAEIRIYPIKGGRGVLVPNAEVQPIGLKHDRRFMLVDSKGVFLSQRKLPKMTLLQSSLASNSLNVSFPGASLISIPLNLKAKKTKVKVWSSTLEAWLVDEKIDDWFSNVLESPVRLVMMDDSCHRPMAGGMKIKSGVSFADFSPISVNNFASLHSLSKDFDSQLPINRFRANLSIAGATAWQEETWRKIQIGDVIFQILKPIGRCQVPSINQETAEVPLNPKLVLDHLRTVSGKGDFGMHTVATQIGMIYLNDEVLVLD